MNPELSLFVRAVPQENYVPPVFCWARTLTRLSESCAGRFFSKTGRKLRKVLSGSPEASRNRSVRGSRSEVVADRQSLRELATISLLNESVSYKITPRLKMS